MSIEAIVTLVIGATLLWGGLLLAIAHYVRSSRSDGVARD